jgi:hypothetical protein
MNIDIQSLREGRIEGADDTETLTIRKDGHVMTVTGAPPERCRIGRGIVEVMKRSRLDADVTGTWDDLRAWAAEVGLLVDPRDDPGPEPDKSSMSELIGMR